MKVELFTKKLKHTVKTFELCLTVNNKFVFYEIETINGNFQSKQMLDKTSDVFDVKERIAIADFIDNFDFSST